MVSSQYPFPQYVRHGQKDASADSVEGMYPANYQLSSYPTDSQENVWLSSVKLACLVLSQKSPNWKTLKRQQTTAEYYTKKVKEAAARYDMLDDVEKAVSFVERFASRREGISTERDLESAWVWFRKNAAFLDPQVKLRVLDHLEAKEAEFGCVPSLTEIYERREHRGLDPITAEMEKMAEAHLHELATGKVYFTNQFGELPEKELNDYLPDLVKEASLGTGSIVPVLLGEAAARLKEEDAIIVDALMAKHAQVPYNDRRKAAIEINDAVLVKI